MKKITCYFTGGWTESGAMTEFLNKINNQFYYQQRCPNKPKYKRGLANHFSGLTGESLINYIIKDMQNHLEEVNTSSAILIEDDLDGKFSNCFEDFIKYQSLVTGRIQGELKTAIPVLFFAASPEIESWILSDWDNSFGSIYDREQGGTLNHKDNCYFSMSFRKYTYDYVLMGYKDNIEDYGFFNGVYRKLSDELIQAFKIGYRDSLTGNQTYYEKIACNKYLYYSKRLHGDKMLRNINPDNVAKKCSKYFKQAFCSLQALN